MTELASRPTYFTYSPLCMNELVSKVYSVHVQMPGCNNLSPVSSRTAATARAHVHLN